MIVAIEVILPTAGYALRPWRSGDAEDLYRAINHPSVGEFLADWYPKDGYSLHMAHDWVNGGADVGGTNWTITCNDVAVGSAGIHP